MNVMNMVYVKGVWKRVHNCSGTQYKQASLYHHGDSLLQQILCFLPLELLGKCFAQFLVCNRHLLGDRWCNWSSQGTNIRHCRSTLVPSLMEFAFSLRSSFNSALGHLYRIETLCVLDLEGLLALFSSKTVILVEQSAGLHCHLVLQQQTFHWLCDFSKVIPT